MISIFIFYDDSRGIQAKLGFSKHFRHVDLFTNQGDHWVLFRLGQNGIIYRVSRFKDSAKLVKHLMKIKTVTAVVGVSLDERAKSNWLPLMGRSCNEIARWISGVDIGFTFNPRHLYNKLLKCDNQRNYTILFWWRRKNVW